MELFEVRHDRFTYLFSVKTKDKSSSIYSSVESIKTDSTINTLRKLLYVTLPLTRSLLCFLIRRATIWKG